MLAFWLAVDPGLVIVSRQVNGPMMALSFSLLALGLWHAHRTAWAGIFAGLALLSGPAFWQGALGLGSAWLFYRLLLRSAAHPGEVFDETNPPKTYPARADTLRWLAAFHCDNIRGWHIPGPLSTGPDGHPGFTDHLPERMDHALGCQPDDPHHRFTDLSATGGDLCPDQPGTMAVASAPIMRSKDSTLCSCLCCGCSPAWS